MSKFVPYKIGVKLKEKGFSQGFGDYRRKLVYYDSETLHFISELCAYEQEWFGENVPCPSLDDAKEWLREKKGVHIGTVYTGKDYSVWIQPLNNIDTQTVIHDFESCGAAEVGGIEYALDNLV